MGSSMTMLARAKNTTGARCRDRRLSHAHLCAVSFRSNTRCGGRGLNSPGLVVRPLTRYSGAARQGARAPAISSVGSRSPLASLSSSMRSIFLLLLSCLAAASAFMPAAPLRKQAVVSRRSAGVAMGEAGTNYVVRVEVELEQGEPCVPESSDHQRRPLLCTRRSTRSRHATHCQQCGSCAASLLSELGQPPQQLLLPPCQNHLSNRQSYATSSATLVVPPPTGLRRLSAASASRRTPSATCASSATARRSRTRMTRRSARTRRRRCGWRAHAARPARRRPPASRHPSYLFRFSSLLRRVCRLLYHARMRRRRASGTCRAVHRTVK